MESKERLAHLIRIAQLEDRNRRELASSYRRALNSESALGEFLTKLEGPENQIHEMTLLDLTGARVFAFFIIARDLNTLASSDHQFDEELLEAAAKVFVVGFYGKVRALVSKEIRNYPVLIDVYSRGKRK